MHYHSTRGGDTGLNFTDILMAGLASDGGLYVPDAWPAIQWPEADTPYHETAYAVIQPFIAGAIPDDDLYDIITETYTTRPDGFTDSAITPITQLKPGVHLMDLFHGPTLAFKDVALQLLGRLLDYQLGREDKHVTIIGATSGDTGSAAIQGCKNCQNARIVILHPHGRTSEVQRRQMTCVDSPNVYNLAIEGSFDDCQTIVKTLFGTPSFRSQQNLTAVNSINWARIMAQCVYYVRAAQMLNTPSIRFSVPTGNFGNIYAAHVMRRCNLPMSGLIIASNRNDILTRFFETGTMRLEDVIPSNSPSMDIQISSNFERLLAEHMPAKDLSLFIETFKDTGQATLSAQQMDDIRGQFHALRCNDETTLATMKTIYDETGLILDPHTAVGVHAAMKADPSDENPIISMACAHPAKFPDAVRQAIGHEASSPDSLTNLFGQKEHYTVLPAQVDAVRHFIETL